MNQTNENYCYYSDLPSPMAYMEPEHIDARPGFSESDINRIIEMAWEDRTTFDAIKFQFGLRESDVKGIMKSQLKWSSYKLWRARVGNCKTKHQKTRSNRISRFKCNLQRQITFNKISKRAIQ
jgi:uncharacterized protein (TIGR03643 family)